jgi:ribosomal protein S18 acetylase RimI-like enzyme
MKSDQCVIRSIRADDLATFKALRLEALRDHPEAFGSDYEESLREPESYWQERVGRAIESDGQIIFLADAGSELAGMLGVFRSTGAKNKHAAMIWGVYTRPAYRGCGLTEKLMREAIAWAAKQNVRILRLAVGTFNAPAIHCYQRCGFIVYGVSPEEIRVGDVYHDEILMFRRV